jgi:guanylate kinase
MESDRLSVVKTLLETYRPSNRVRNLLEKYPPLLLVGISGAGKDTVKNELHLTGQYFDFVSYTTRQPRLNHGVMEMNDKDYHFITLEEAERMLREGEFIEAAEYSGNIYGTGIHDLELAAVSRKIALNDIEVQGVKQYRALSSRPTAVFLLPPSYDEWQARLSKRYGKSDSATDNIKLRIETAEKELRHALAQDHFIFIVNDELTVTMRKVQQAVNANGRSDDNEARVIANELISRIQQAG